MTIWKIYIRTSKKGNDSGTDAKVRYRMIYQNIGATVSQREEAYGPYHEMGKVEDATQAGGAYILFPLEEAIPDNMELSGIQLSHDNSGHKPGWRIDKFGLFHQAGQHNMLYGYIVEYPDGEWIAADEPGSNVWKEMPENKKITEVERKFLCKLGQNILGKYGKENVISDF